MPDVGDAGRPSGAQPNAILRTMAILDVLGQSAGGMTVVEIARATGLSRPVVHRALKALESREMTRSHDSKHALGPGMLRLGFAYLDRMSYRESVLHAAIDLWRSYVEEKPWMVSITMPMGQTAVITDRLWTRATPLGVILDLGTILPYDRSATGRAILANVSDQHASQLIGQERFEAVRDELERIRATGSAQSINELRPGLFAVASAVCSREGAPLAAIAIAGLSLDGEIPDLQAMTIRVRSAAESIAPSISIADAPLGLEHN